MGAGTGATVGKLFGMSQAMKSGIGSGTVALEGGYAGVQVAALAAVNAFGDIVDPETGTLVVVATNARLTRIEARKLDEQAQLGVARAIRPVNTMLDGDLVIALSLGNQQAGLDALGVAAAEAVCHAILRAVRLASSLGGVPGLAR